MIRNRRQLDAMTDGINFSISKITFEVTEEHIKLLQNAYVSWNDCETGAPGMDCKRPYGNSYVSRDIAEILGWWDKDKETEGEEWDLIEDRAYSLHNEMEKVVQILFDNASIGLKPGTFEKPSPWSGKWKPSKVLERKYKMEEIKNK